jgi:formyltetrahydrofolate deformylase
MVSLTTFHLKQKAGIPLAFNKLNLKPNVKILAIPTSKHSKAGRKLHTSATTTPNKETVHIPAPTKSNGTSTSISPQSPSKQQEREYKATLLVKCKDAKGVVASLAQLLYGLGCNITQSDQFSEDDMFFQRIELDYSDLLVGVGNTIVLENGVEEVARRFNMEWRIAYQDRVKKAALLVSKLDHCLYDLLIRRESGELNIDIPIIISNHPSLESVADKFEVDFVHLPVDGKNPTDKAAQEARLDTLLQEKGIDFLVLARYMQIFSKDFCERHAHHTINIHHSFLPAFEGGRPYHRAHERGVKIIGATAHYATAELDAGPIIAQDVTRVSHRDGVKDLVRKGRDLERLVLSRAVRWHIQDRIIVHNNKTVVFEE